MFEIRDPGPQGPLSRDPLSGLPRKPGPLGCDP
eukprot:UN11175